jgi:Flp pilus assembly protein TadD
MESMSQSKLEEQLRPIEAMAEEGRIDQAIGAMKDLVESRPDSAEVHNDMAVLLHAKGHVEDAFEAINRALRIEPQNVMAQRNLVAIQIARGRAHEAARALEPILKTNPKDAEALTLAGDLSMVLGRAEDALVFYQTAIAADTETPGLVYEKLAAAERAVEEEQGLRTATGHA